MGIQTKITLLVTLLTGLVAASIAASLLWMENRRVREDAAIRIQAIMEGVLRISREAITAKDDLMLISYLRHLMREYPEIEVAILTLQDYSSVMGEVTSDLFYRTVTISDKESSAFKPLPRPMAQTAGLAHNTAHSKPGVRTVSAPRPPSLPPGTVTVRLGFSKSALERQIRRAQTGVASQILSIGAVVLLLGVAGSLGLARVLSRPIAALAQAADQIGRGQLDARVEPSGQDELAHLAGRFNDMAARLQNSIRFKEDLMGTLSHEMRAPLTGLKGFLELLLDPQTAHGLTEKDSAYRTMFDAVSQIEVSLVNALDLFGATPKPEVKLESVPVEEVAAEVIRLFEPAARSKGVLLTGSAPSSVTAQADRELLRRVLANLVLNAVNYTPSLGTVRVGVAAQAGEIHVSVADTGPGIPEEYRDKIFEKFYRASGPGGRQRRIPGSGLGLAIAKRAVELHGGRIWVESVVGQGSVFHVTLPQSGSANLAGGTNG